MSRIARRAPARLAAIALCALSVGCMTVVEDDDAPKPPEEQALARRNLGIDHLLSGRTAMAIRELRHAAKLDDTDAATHLWLGEAYRRKNRMDDALAHTSRATELDPENHEARLNLSVLYVQTGKFEDAIREANVLIDDPTFPSPWRPLTNRGWCELKLRRYDAARKSFEEALEFNYGHWPAVLNLGILAQVEGRHAESVRFFDEVLKGEPGVTAESEANYRMAEAFVSLGDRERAIKHLEQAIEIAPHGRWGRQSTEYLALLR